MEFYATLGNACSKAEVLDRLFRAGMTGARLNLSHTALSRCAPLLNEGYWPAARRAGRPEAHLILDMQGPELRIGELPNPIPLRQGDQVLLGDGGIPVPKAVLEYARPGQQISIDDSALLLEVRKASSRNLLCKIIQGGPLRSRKSMSILGTEVNTPTLTQADLGNLALAEEFGVTHILQPFVRGRRDMEHINRVMGVAMAAITGSPPVGDWSKADVIRETMRRLGLTEADKPAILMVGDRKFDVLGARECGIDCVGVEFFGYAAPGELAQAGAVAVVRTAEELEAFLLDHGDCR